MYINSAILNKYCNCISYLDHVELVPDWVIEHLTKIREYNRKSTKYSSRNSSDKKLTRIDDDGDEKDTYDSGTTGRNNLYIYRPYLVEIFCKYNSIKR